MVAYELKNNASVTSRGEAPVYSVQDRDNLQLQRLGKKPVLKVCDRIDILQLIRLLNILRSETSGSSQFWGLAVLFLVLGKVFSGKFVPSVSW